MCRVLGDVRRGGRLFAVRLAVQIVVLATFGGRIGGVRKASALAADLGGDRQMIVAIFFDVFHVRYGVRRALTGAR
ncbi:MAG TPA: hypothetical protein VL484_14080 [Vicinamibacterales bacterium]|nr:hypothetical protein [Vicinamibacterales bacterium]